MLPTPSTSHVNYAHIYEPAEDSYLLLDTLSSAAETSYLHARFPEGSSSLCVLEVGPGSGVVLAFMTANAGRIIGRTDVATLGVDANSLACLAASRTVHLATKEATATAGGFLDCVAGDLTAVVRPASVDVLVFNPPYVPSESLPSLHGTGDSGSAFQRDMHLSSLATDGGVDGMETTNRLLSELPTILSQRGVAYILLCAQNRPEQVMAGIRDWPEHQGRTWHAVIVGSSGKRAGWEKLCVIRIWRNN